MNIASLIAPVLLLSAVAGGTAYAAEATNGDVVGAAVSAPAKKLTHHKKKHAPQVAKPSSDGVKP